MEYSQWSNDSKNPQGDFVCPKCHKKCGIEREASDYIGTTDPWRRHRCKNCGYNW